MYIKTLKIDAFGVLRCREIELSPTLNIIEGENESGKSALAMFIKFMFYGLSGKSVGGDLSERRRYVNWDTGTAAGSMTLEIDGREYRIERQLNVSSMDDGGKSRESVRENVRILDAATNTPIHRGEIPGEALLGVPENIFMNTVFVRQIDGTRPAGASVLTSIENLLFAADESVGTEKALSRLEDARRQILHKNENGGKLYELKNERSQIAAALSAAISADSALSEAEDALDQADEECAALDEKIRRQTLICEYGEICLVKRRFDTLASGTRALAEMRRSLEEQKKAGIDRAWLAQLDTCAARLTESSAAADKLTAAAEAQRDKFLAASAATTKVEAEQERVLTQAENHLTRVRSMTAAAFTLFFFAILMGVGAWLLATFDVSLYAVPIVMAAVLGALGVLCIILRARANGALADLLREWGALGVGELAAAVASSMGGNAPLSTLDTECKQLNAARDEAHTRLNAEMERAAALICQANLQVPEEAEVTAMLTALQNARDAGERICTEIETKQKEADTLAGRLSLLKEQLAAEDEADIRRKFEENIHTVEGRIASGLDVAHLDAARRELESLRTNRQKSVEKQHKLDTHVAAGRAVSASPTALAERLSTIDEQIGALRDQHEAYCLAIETMTRASETVRSGVLPRVVQEACASANRLSNGKFEAIGIDHALSMSFTRNGQTRGVEYLSEGTKDLAYISLRRALSHALFGRACPPLIYDESFARIDEKRLSRILDMLHDPAGGDSQSIVLSCRRLEAELAAENGGASVIRL